MAFLKLTRHLVVSPRAVNNAGTERPPRLHAGERTLFCPVFWFSVPSFRNWSGLRPDWRGATIMRLGTTLCFVALLSSQAANGDDQKPDGNRLKRNLIGTWEAARPAGVPNSMRHIKHVTSTHYTWVTYDSESDTILATSGRTCSVKGDRYEEICEFATDSHQQLRGNTYRPPREGRGP
jgi:hypothetical protein